MKIYFIILIFIFVSFKVFSQNLDVNFYANSTKGCLPFVVKFYNSSSPTNGISYNWNFGNGASSQVNEPTITYNDAGQYTVSLIISDGINIDTLVMNNYITVYNNPEPNFEIINKNIGCVPYTVQFKDITSIGNSQIVYWNWDFGDGQVNNLQNPNHIFNYQNIFDVSLFVIDFYGCKGTTVKNKFIETSKPKVYFSSSDSVECDGDLNAKFNSSAIGIPDFEYYWDFGDGYLSNNQNPTHYYNQTGIYDVKLKNTIFAVI